MPFRSLTSTSFGATALGSVGMMAWLWLSGCDNDYPIAPTACDDWCYATARADCKEDASPDDCVTDCEETALGRRYPACEPAWITLTECYRAAPDSDFTCIDDYSEPSNTLCLDERRAANYCVSEGQGLCFDKCVRRVEACGGTLGDCEEECSTATDGCVAEQIEYDRCLVKAPVECSTGVAPSELQCCEQLVALLECAGYEGEGCPG